MVQSDCNAYGPYPTDYCYNGIKWHCIDNGTEYLMEFVEYDTRNCDGNIINQQVTSCDNDWMEGWCNCGYQTCQSNQMMTVDRGTLSDDGSCGEYMEHYVVQDTCIDGRWIPNNTEAISVVLICDEDAQEIRYYSWNNENCRGRSNERDEAQLLQIFGPDECVEIICAAGVDVILPSTTLDLWSWFTSTTQPPDDQHESN